MTVFLRGVGQSSRVREVRRGSAHGGQVPFAQLRMKLHDLRKAHDDHLIDGDCGLAIEARVTRFIEHRTRTAQGGRRDAVGERNLCVAFTVEDRIGIAPTDSARHGLERDEHRAHGQ